MTATAPSFIPPAPSGQRPPLDPDGDTAAIPRPADELDGDNALEQPDTADHGEQQG